MEAKEGDGMHCLFTPREGFSQRKSGLQNLHEELRCWLSPAAEFVYLQSHAPALVLCSYPNIWKL